MTYYLNNIGDIAEIDQARRELDDLRRALADGQPVGEAFAEAHDRLYRLVAYAKAARHWVGDHVLDLLAAPRLDEDGR